MSASWYDYFQRAAEKIADEDCRKASFDGSAYSVGEDSPPTSVRRDAVASLFSEPMRCAPPSDYAWPAQNERRGAIDPNDFLEGIQRRHVDRRADLWYDPCPANTTYGLGWFTMRGFEPAQPAPTPKGCAEPVLYEER